MSRDPARVRARRKSNARRLGRDVRLWLPFLGLVGCYSLSATAIVVSERATNASPADEADHLTISISSTSNVSAAPGGISGDGLWLP
jgi:hypothetical protein